MKIVNETGMPSDTKIILSNGEELPPEDMELITNIRLNLNCREIVKAQFDIVGIEVDIKSLLARDDDDE